MDGRDEEALKAAWAAYTAERGTGQTPALQAALSEALGAGCSLRSISEALGVSRRRLRTHLAGQTPAAPASPPPPVPPSIVKAYRRAVRAQSERQHALAAALVSLVAQARTAGWKTAEIARATHADPDQLRYLEANVVPAPSVHHFVLAPRARTPQPAPPIIDDPTADRLRALAAERASGPDYAALVMQLRAAGASYADIDRAAGLPRGRSRSRLLNRGLIP